MWKIRIILENVKIKSIFSVSLLMFAAPSFFNYVTNGISYFGNCETAFFDKIGSVKVKDLLRIYML